jgi:hypothetical protein
LRAYYVKNGWLEQPAQSVYQRPRGSLGWQQIVISFQTLLEAPFVVGGKTALDLQGFAHFLAHEIKKVRLYGPANPQAGFRSSICRNALSTTTLFRNEPITFGLGSLAWDVASGKGRDLNRFQGGSLTELSWGQWGCPLTLSQPERACLELLNELPRHESFHQANMIMQEAVNFSPRRLKKLLNDCDSIKVKRLFFFFADRHDHSWLKRLVKETRDFGAGKRMLVKGGRLDPVYMMTVPDRKRPVCQPCRA